MTPLEAIGYAFAALIVSPVVLSIAAGVVFVGFMLGLFVWESTKAQVVVCAGVLLWLTAPSFVRWVNAPKVVESCSQRCDVFGQSQQGRFMCLERCYESQKLIQENEGVKP